MFSVTTVLVLIEHYVSQESWLFAISVLIAWPLADKLYKGIIDFFNIEEQTQRRPIGFLVYAGAILGASVVAAFVSQQILLPLNLPTSENLTTIENVTSFLGGNLTLSPPTVVSKNPPVALGNVVMASFVASFVAYVFSNWSELEETIREYRESLYIHSRRDF